MYRWWVGNYCIELTIEFERGLPLDHIIEDHYIWW